jgi:hypothetical protein
VGGLAARHREFSRRGLECLILTGQSDVKGDRLSVFGSDMHATGSPARKSPYVRPAFIGSAPTSCPSATTRASLAYPCPPPPSGLGCTEAGGGGQSSSCDAASSRRRAPRRRKRSPSFTSFMRPGSTSTRTHPGHAAATRPTVYLPEVRGTATCGRGSLCERAVKVQWNLFHWQVEESMVGFFSLASWGIGKTTEARARACAMCVTLCVCVCVCVR